jgi:Transglycosylase
VKRSASRGVAKKWILVALVVLLLIPAMQVAVVRFVNPPVTLPMLIDQGSAMFSSAQKRPLLYRWIALPQIPEMFLEHLWISEDQRFFQHEGFDWKEMDLAVKEASGKGNRFVELPRSRTNAPGRSSSGRAAPGSGKDWNRTTRSGWRRCCRSGASWSCMQM